MEKHEQKPKGAEYRVNEKIFRYTLLDDSREAFDTCGANMGNLGLCSRAPTGHCDLAICYNPSNQGYFIQGKQSCHSVSSCPVCSYNIALDRVNVIHSLVWCVRKFGYGVYLLTLTCRHTSNNSLGDLITRLGFACNELFRRHDVRDYLKKIGCIGRITSYEVMMLGKNGFHPHYHILFIAEEDLDYIVIARDLLKIWIECLDKYGLWCNEHGLDVQGYKGVGDYINKMSLEMCLLNFKYGQNDDSVTPFQCLKLYHDTKDEDIAKIWVKYCKCIKGKRIQVWSRGLIDIYKIMRTILNDKVIKYINDGKGLIFLDHYNDYNLLSPLEWQCILRDLYQGKLEIVEEKLKSVQISYYINYNYLNEIKENIF